MHYFGADMPRHVHALVATNPAKPLVRAQNKGLTRELKMSTNGFRISYPPLKGALVNRGLVVRRARPPGRSIEPGVA